MLSVIIITKNEEHDIVRCLESIKWVDEIIIFDSSSTDKTVSLCQAYTDKIFITKDWPGYGAQKQRALDKASHEWVLSIDADEVVTSELHHEIQTVLTHPTHSGYAIYRLNYICQQPLYYSSHISKDYVVRLVKRQQAHFTQRMVHEALQTEGTIGKLNHPLSHYTYRHLDEMLNKLNEYTTLSAQQLHQQGKTSGITKASVHGIWTFLQKYFLCGGILDGRIGWIFSVYCAQSSYYKYLKLQQANLVNKF